MLNNFLIILVVREKMNGRLALAIPAGAPATLADKMIQAPLLVALKIISNNLVYVIKSSNIFT